MDKIIKQFDKLRLAIYKANLTEKEKIVISKRYFEVKTLAEVGKDLKLTRQRILQIECKALLKIAFYLEHEKK